jgi:hypothetical protein
MSIHLSQEIVGKLSDQELDTYVKVVLDESRSRRRKLGRAKNYRGRQIIPSVICLVGAGASHLSSMLGWEFLIVFFAAVALQQWHMAGVNKRIDALIDLLEFDPITNPRNDGKSELPKFRNQNQETEQ